MMAIWAELHTFLIYAVFGYLLIYPLLLGCLRFFAIKDPGQRRLLYLLALSMPLVGFAAYHSIFLKQCEGGHFIFGTTPEYLHLLCLLSDFALQYTSPILALVLTAGLLKAVTAALFTRRLTANAVNPEPGLADRITKITRRRAAELGITPPALVYSRRKGFAALSAGLLKPGIILNHNLLADLSLEELDFIITHELVHVRRRDNIKTWLVNLVRDLVIFNPISTVLLRQIDYETERICDREAAKLTGLDGQKAAAILIKVWKRLAAEKLSKPVLVSAFSAGPTGMERRVITFINNESQTPPASFSVFGSLVLLLIASSLIYFGILC
ncbi:MAG: hypothetical protein FJ152_07630 [Firmicutes bacterium]|nr:hypothetical protein [Bacillota bacterium]